MRNMLAAGLSEKMAMMISGHKTRSMIDRYQIIDERDIELAGEKMAAYEARQRQLRQEAAEKGKVREEVREADLNHDPLNTYKI